MQNYNQQQQAVILKGIAQQILQMNVPTFEQANKLFEMFGKTINDSGDYSSMYRAVGVALMLNDCIKVELSKGDMSNLQHSIVHECFKEENNTEFKLRNKILGI